MMKKQWSYCFAAISFLTCSFADNNYSENKMETGETTPKKTGGAYRLHDCAITPDAGPRVAEGADVFMTADFIYWSVRQDGLGYGETGNSFSQKENAKKGSVHHVNFDWEPGLKIGLGINLNHDGWDIYAQYTWLHADPSRSTVKKAQTDERNMLLPMRLINRGPNFSGDPSLIFASGSWDLHFNVIDFELGRNFYVSKYLTIRPHIGIKGTWQKDDLSIKYRNPSSNPQVTLFIKSRLKDDIAFGGVGIRAGLNNAWYFIRNFCLFGDFALTALRGHFEVHRKDFTEILDAPNVKKLTTRNTKNSIYSIKGILELTIGLRYDIWFKDDDYHFGLQAGWEEQIWFNHNMHYKRAEEVAHGDLVLHGLTFKVRYDF